MNTFITELCRHVPAERLHAIGSVCSGVNGMYAFLRHSSKESETKQGAWFRNGILIDSKQKRAAALILRADAA